MIFHARPPCADSLAAHSLRSGGTVWTYPLAGNHSYYFMLTERFWHWMGPKQGWSEPDDAGPATIDIGLAFSTVRSCVIVAGIWAAVSKDSSENLARQDGVRFTHLGEREAFIGLGREGSFDSRMVWGIPSPVVMEEHGEIWFYFSGRRKPRCQAPADARPLAISDRRLGHLQVSTATTLAGWTRVPRDSIPRRMWAASVPLWTRSSTRLVADHCRRCAVRSFASDR